MNRLVVKYQGKSGFCSFTLNRDINTEFSLSSIYALHFIKFIMVVKMSCYIAPYGHRINFLPRAALHNKAKLLLNAQLQFSGFNRPTNVCKRGNIIGLGKTLIQVGLSAEN